MKEETNIFMEFVETNTGSEGKPLYEATHPEAI